MSSVSFSTFFCFKTKKFSFLEFFPCNAATKISAVRLLLNDWRRRRFSKTQDHRTHTFHLPINSINRNALAHENPPRRERSRTHVCECVSRFFLEAFFGAKKKHTKFAQKVRVDLSNAFSIHFVHFPGDEGEGVGRGWEMRHMRASRHSLNFYHFLTISFHFGWAVVVVAASSSPLYIHMRLTVCWCSRPLSIFRAQPPHFTCCSVQLFLPTTLFGAKRRNFL